MIVLITSCFCLSHQIANFLSKNWFLTCVNTAHSMLRSWQLAKPNETPQLPFPPQSQETPKYCLIMYYNFFPDSFFFLQYLPASFYAKEGSWSYSKTEGGLNALTTKLYSTLFAGQTRLLCVSSGGNPAQQKSHHPCSRRIKRWNSFCTEASSGPTILSDFKRWPNLSHLHKSRTYFLSPVQQQQIWQCRKWSRYTRVRRSSTDSYPILATGHHGRITK